VPPNAHNKHTREDNLSNKLDAASVDHMIVSLAVMIVQHNFVKNLAATINSRHS